MTLAEQAERRVDLAHQLGVEPRHWVATPAAAHALPIAAGALLGVPLIIGTTRSEWGLDLEMAGRR